MVFEWEINNSKYTIQDLRQELRYFYSLRLLAKYQTKQSATDISQDSCFDYLPHELMLDSLKYSTESFDLRLQ